MVKKLEALEKFGPVMDRGNSVNLVLFGAASHPAGGGVN
jgi:hypothetical protein